MLHNIAKHIVRIQNRLFYRSLLCNDYQNKTINSLDLSKLPRKNRCFIVGNGPSLTIADLELLRNEDCFAANLIFKIFPETEWRPRYYVVQDRYARIDEFLKTEEVPYVFIGSYFWRTRGCENRKAYCFHHEECLSGETLKFCIGDDYCFYDSCTVTYTMIQMAVKMGYEEIYLLGIDHNYPSVIDEKGNVSIKSTEKSHFFKDERPGEVIANLIMMEKGYRKAKEVVENLGIKIYNTTRGGLLDVFVRKHLEDVFKD